jgi:hypothetical protein
LRQEAIFRSVRDSQSILVAVEGDAVDEELLFAAIARCGARALLIGRRALVALGLPVLTADYDFWLHAEDIEAFNAALHPLGLAPSRSADEARSRGRYVLENGEHVDVLVAREVRTVTGHALRFDDVWGRREELAFDAKTRLVLPSLNDLIATKRFANRPKDLEDIRLLEVLRARRGT